MSTDEKEMELLVRDKRRNAMRLHKTYPSSEGGPPCKRCLSSWRLSLLITNKRKELKRLSESLRIIKENHPKCDWCGILFGDLHYESPITVLETGEQLCSACFNLFREKKANELEKTKAKD